jgi:hypothetical protein
MEVSNMSPRSIVLVLLVIPLLFACGTPLSTNKPTATLTPGQPVIVTMTPTLQASGPTLTVTPQSNPPVTEVTSVPAADLPNFDYIVLVVLENKEFGSVINNPQMPFFNQLAKSYTLLTQDFAIRHPSVPNYLALTGGDTFGATSDCLTCFVDSPSIADLIEKSGRTWKAYEENMPSPCFLGTSDGLYYMKHNPFLYYNSIRNDPARCAKSDVPYTQLASDVSTGALPNFSFITPNMCDDAHSCEVSSADAWLQKFMDQIQPALDAAKKPYLIIITWDEGSTSGSCCGLPAQAGGRIATVLVSPQVKNGFEDSTPYSHYSILKTISAIWRLPYLGHAADSQTSVISAPWK